MNDWLLIDKALVYGENMELSISGDFTIVSGYWVILQAAQNRVLAYLDTRKFDDRFGSNLSKSIHNMPSFKITDAIVNNHVSYALQPMILDGRIKTINSVKIISRDKDSIMVEIVLTLGTYTGALVIEVGNFIS